MISKIRNRELLVKQCKYIDRLLLDNLIRQVKFGVELEFVPAELPKLSAEQQRNIKSLKKKVLAHAEDNPVKLASVREFNAEQLMMYELHELDKKTKDRLEYLFGTGRGDNSYYDAVIGAMRCMEVKLKPDSSEEIVTNLAMLAARLQKKADDYGIKITEPKIQLNISFYDDSGNLADPHNKNFLTRGAQIISGIIDAIYQGAPLCDFLYKSATGAVPLISLGISREGFARIVGEGDNARLELRLSRTGATLADMDIEYLIEAIIKPGIILGLQKKNHGLKKIRRGIFNRSGDDFKITTHVLQGSHILNTLIPNIYKLKPPENYITGWLYLNFAKICMELGHEPISPTINMEDIKFLDEKKYPALIAAYKATGQKRMEYARTLKAKKRNPIEELEYQFLNLCIRTGEIFWPEDNVFYQHFRAQAATAMTLPQLLGFFRNIKIIKKGKNYKIKFPNHTKLFGRKIPVKDENLGNAIQCGGFIDGLWQNKKELPVRHNSIPKFFGDFFGEVWHDELKIGSKNDKKANAR